MTAHSPTFSDARRALIAQEDRPWTTACAFCAHWKSAQIVMDGSTIGYCVLWDATVPSGFGCDQLQPQPIRVLAIGETRHD